MFKRLKTHLLKVLHAGFAKRVLDLPALQASRSRTLIISSVSHSDLLMYLVAIKSFCHFVGHHSVVILNDGTLTSQDLQLIKDHVSPLEIIDLDGIPYRGDRKGVRWGILLAIADRLVDHYVIQLDSDTVTVAALPEVADAIEANTAFTLTSAPEFDIGPIEDICELLKDDSSQHVQKVAERSFVKMRNFSELRYIRGNSGLAGFPRGAFTRSDVEDYFEEMLAIVGEGFRARGSYQVSSNFWVANSPGARALPFGKYTTVHPRYALDNTAFFHFIGNHRFANYSYIAQTVKAIDVIRSADAFDNVMTRKRK